MYILDRFSPSSTFKLLVKRLYFFVIKIQYDVKLRMNSLREITLTNCDYLAVAGVEVIKCKYAAQLHCTS